MYPSLRNQGVSAAGGPTPALSWPCWVGVGRNVVFLGLTSLFTDISSEMVGAVLPLYLMFELRFTPLQFGVFDGLYQGVTALVRLAGGLVADRRQRYKEVAGAGYALSAVCKLGLLAAGTAWIPTTTFLFLDRVGKGVRTAPRDALIALSSPQAGRAQAFGVHRALDTVGALLGPIIAFGLLGRLPGAFDVVFVTSFCAGGIGVGLLLCFVANRVPAAGRLTPQPAVSLRGVVGLLRVPPFRALLIAGVMLSLVSVSDAFIYLTFQRRSEMHPSFFPLLYVGTALIYLLLAIPAGRLADRLGRARVLLGGYLLLLGVYGVLLLPALGPVEFACCLLLLGAYYAATDGVLMALASTTLPSGMLTSGLAMLTTATAVARVVAAVLFGALWSWGGPESTLAVFMVGLAFAMVLASGALAPSQEPTRT
jgi:MFS family permease